MSLTETAPLAEVDALARVAALDLARFRPKLMAKLHWTAELCDQVEDRYRKYLALMMLYPDQPLAPTGFIDEFWHAHILDTPAYHRDCVHLFGSYRHHRPSFAGDPPEQQRSMRNGFVNTRDLFRQHFGKDPWTEVEREEYERPLCICVG